MRRIILKHQQHIKCLINNTGLTMKLFMQNLHKYVDNVLEAAYMGLHEHDNPMERSDDEGARMDGTGGVVRIF